MKTQSILCREDASDLPESLWRNTSGLFWRFLIAPSVLNSHHNVLFLLLLVQKQAGNRLIWIEPICRHAACWQSLCKGTDEWHMETCRDIYRDMETSLITMDAMITLDNSDSRAMSDQNNLCRRLWRVLLCLTAPPQRTKECSRSSKTDHGPTWTDLDLSAQNYSLRISIFWCVCKGFQIAPSKCQYAACEETLILAQPFWTSFKMFCSICFYMWC